MEIQLKTQANDVNITENQECIIEKYKLYYPFTQECYSNNNNKISWIKNTMDIPVNTYDHAGRTTTFNIYVARKIDIKDLNKMNEENKKYGSFERTTTTRQLTDQDEQFIIFDKKLLAHIVYDNKNGDRLYIMPKITELPSYLFQPSLEEARKRLSFYIIYYNNLSSNHVANKMINFYMDLKYGD